MKIFFQILIFLFVAIFIFFRAMDAWIKYKNKQVGKKYCESNGFKFLNAKSYELHTRLYFEKSGIKSWANYETDKNYCITWKKETPLEKVNAILMKK